MDLFIPLSVDNNLSMDVNVLILLTNQNGVFSACLYLF